MTQAEPALTCRKAESNEDAFKIGRLLVEMAQEVARVHMGEKDFIDAYSEVLEIVKEGRAFMVQDERGLVVASLGLQWANPWYAPRARVLVENWLYVLPALRGGKSIKLLEAAAVEIADELQTPIFLKYFDPARLCSEKGRLYVGEEKGYIPTGRIVRIAPSGVPVVDSHI